MQPGQDLQLSSHYGARDRVRAPTLFLAGLCLARTPAGGEARHCPLLMKVSGLRRGEKSGSLSGFGASRVRSVIMVRKWCLGSDVTPQYT